MTILTSGRLVSSGFGDVPEGSELHFIELCAGAHRLCDVACDSGMKAMAMDATYREYRCCFKRVCKA